MKRSTEKAIKQAIRQRTGLRGLRLVEAYVIGSYSKDPSEDVNIGCDQKVPLRDLEVKAGDKLDCYVYVTGFFGEEELDQNIEVELGPNLEVVAALTTMDLIRQRRANT